MRNHMPAADNRRERYMIEKKRLTACFHHLMLLCILGFFASGCGSAIPKIDGIAYYVDCTKGNDANPGTSPSKPWGTLNKVNVTVFGPGDGIFFKRGSTCSGTLHPQGSGVDGKPITLGAYGWGERPTIDGGSAEVAFELRNQQYWEIQDIEITGGSVFGIHITSDGGAGTLNHFRLTHLVVHDVNGGPVSSKESGLVVLSSYGSNSILNDIVVDDVTAYNTNQWAGIMVTGLGSDYRADPPLLSTNVTIRNSTVHNVYGDGIVLFGVKNGLIEKSLAYDTGMQPAPQTIGTPNAIWTWMCHDCIVQYNEAYNTHSPDVDGGAFDVDWGCVNNLYQYNYAHDTDSYCISVFGAGGLTTSNSIVRYNVCSNNGLDSTQANSAGAILLSTWSGGTLDGVQIYNNTIYWNPVMNSNAIVNQATFTGTKPNSFKNNIVYSTAPWILFSNTNLMFDNNLYWYPGDKDTVWLYGDDVYLGFTEYQSKSGQDANSIFADPMLKDFTYHEVGMPRTEFTLLKGSPAIDAGTNMDNLGPRDFFGNPTPFGQGYDIGAFEWQRK